MNLLTVGCGEEEIQPPKPPLVKIQQVKLTNVDREENYSGVVHGRYETKLSFQVSGKIISREVQVGSLVRAGQILMTLDPKDIAEQFRSADAQVASTRAQLQLANTNLERYTELFNADAIPAAVLDQYQTQYSAARAAYDAAIAQSQQSRNALDYTTLNADADGVISEVSAEVGQVVSAGQSVLTLVQTNEFEVVVDIPENKIAAVQEGQRVLIGFWATDEKLTGMVREISPIADPASRTFTVKISLPSGADVKLGMTANVSMREELESTLLLPLSAIYQTDNSSKVWLVNGDTVSLKNVEVTDFDENQVQVRGLKSGDTVVVAGVQKLREGQQIRTGEQ